MKRIEEIEKAAIRALKQNGSHIPQLTLFDKEKGIIMLLNGFPEGVNEKIDIMLTIGLKVGAKHDLDTLEEIYFICEAWMAEGKGKIPDNFRPSKAPNRKEVLIITYKDVRKNTTSMRCYELVRKNGQLDVLPFKQPFEDVDSALLDAFEMGYKRGEEK